MDQRRGKCQGDTGDDEGLHEEERYPRTRSRRHGEHTHTHKYGMIVSGRASRAAFCHVRVVVILWKALPPPQLSDLSYVTARLSHCGQRICWKDWLCNEHVKRKKLRLFCARFGTRWWTQSSGTRKRSWWLTRRWSISSTTRRWWQHWPATPNQNWLFSSKCKNTATTTWTSWKPSRKSSCSSIKVSLVSKFHFFWHHTLQWWASHTAMVMFLCSRSVEWRHDLEVVPRSALAKGKICFPGADEENGWMARKRGRRWEMMIKTRCQSKTFWFGWQFQRSPNLSFRLSR